MARDGGGAAAGTNSGAEQRFIRINVAHAAQQFLIQQRALDGRLAATKQREEAIEIRFQRLNAARLEPAGAGNAQASEAAGIDEAQFPARLQLQNRVRVLENFRLRLTDLQASGHAQVDNPLSCRLCGADAPVRLCVRH